jgi:NADH pyrophosphatase NudC (nudix superfamily)
MKKKVLAIIHRNNQFLLLRSEPHKDHGEGGWYTVTGGVENDETYKKAIRREIYEETSLKPIDVISLNSGCIYEWDNLKCLEKYFLVEVQSGNIVLNEEHDRYEWTDLKQFINKIEWKDDKELLREVIVKGLKKELHFKEEHTKEYT